MTIDTAIKYLEKQIKDPSQGLPKEIFLFVSRLVPMVNIDLLIKDEKDRTLLSWRDDQYAGTGWHVPGGIVRFKEGLETRIQKVIEKEIGTAAKVNPVPIAINQVICSHNTRGHFISLLYKCFVSGKFVPKNTGLKKTDNGYLMWHDSYPKNLVKVQQKMYKRFI